MEVRHCTEHHCFMFDTLLRYRKPTTSAGHLQLLNSRGTIAKCVKAGLEELQSEFGAEVADRAAQLVEKLAAEKRKQV